MLADEFVDRVLDLGLSIFRPFEGDSAENRCEDVDVDSAGVDWELTELVEALRKPRKDVDSRALLRAEEVPMSDCLGWRVPVIFGVAPSSPLITPNSLVDMGDGLLEEAPTVEVFKLVLRLARVDVELFRGGLDAADVRLEIRGILVGVSFESPDTEFMRMEDEW